MKKILNIILLSAIAILALSSLVLADDPVISWTDKAGYHEVQLMLVNIVESDPLYSWYTDAWVGDLDIDMDSSIVFTCSGNFDGFTGVRVNQNVKNSTTYAWNDFRIDIDGAYYAWSNYIQNWSFDNTEDLNKLKYYTDSAPNKIGIGSFFYDTLVVDVSNIDENYQNGSFTLTKYAVPATVPEPGSIAVLISGLVGTGSFIFRKRK